MVERLSPDQIGVVGGSEDDARKFIESDYRIRNGLCPNGCGLMQTTDFGQECGKCSFICNTKAENTKQ